MPNEIWTRVTCAWCGVGFEDEDDWFARHSDADGEDVHDECCQICRNEPHFLVEPVDPDDYRDEPKPLPALRRTDGDQPERR